MEAAAATAPSAGEALGARAHAEDREAFRSLYEPHLDGLHDYVLRLVRDRGEAARIVGETFARAREAFPEQGGDAGTWLYATARSYALEALRYRSRRNGDEREALEFTRIDPDLVPEPSVVFDRELVELVWDAAAAMPIEEYSLLALRVRHDLAEGSISEQLGLNGTAGSSLMRARAAFEDVVLSELVVRRTRHICRELDTVSSSGDRRALVQHLRNCLHCRESRRRFVPPTEVLAALAFIAPAGSLRKDVFGRRSRRRRLFGIL
jgi:DNA-directed RNA polymerase specialized sigma24 family protein